MCLAAVHAKIARGSALLYHRNRAFEQRHHVGMLS